MTSNKFEDLQRKAKRIQYISLGKKFFLVGILVSLAVAVYSLYFVKEEVQIIVAPKAKVIKPEIKSEPIIKVNITSKEVIEVTQPKKELVKQKDLHVEKEVDVSYDTVKLKLSIPAKEIENISFGEVNQDKISEEEKVIGKLDETKTQNFVMEVKSANKEEILIRDYSSNKSFESAIELALIYFKKQNFKKAVFWSKEASRIRPESPKPWVVYAKSKHEIGNDEDAIKALENYLSFFSSKEAREFLNTLKKVKK